MRRNKVPDILDTIVAQKRLEVAKLPEPELSPTPCRH
jgi:hypothetical protein